MAAILPRFQCVKPSDAQPLPEPMMTQFNEKTDELQGVKR